MSAIEVEALSKRWTADSGLQPVTFSVEPGELVVVRGRSGSGKSTLLAILAGWCDPDAGAARIAGTPLSMAQRRAWSEVAVVPQVLALVPELTMRENIVASCPPGSLARVDEIIEALGLAEIADRPPPDTSMGQQQRVAVARAVVAQPTVVLADEPSSHQDPAHVAAVVAALRTVAHCGSAVLVASHDETVAEAADRIVDLDV